MTIKQKILDALGISLDDLDEDRLLQILLDAYASKKLRIASLERQQAGIQLAAQRDTEALMEERRRMRTDPCYFMQGEYFFLHRNLGDPRLEQRFVVNVRANRMEMYERRPGADYAVQQVTREEFFK